MIDDLFYDEADRHLHAALRALANDDPEQMVAEIAHAAAAGARWIEALQAAALADASADN